MFLVYDLERTKELTEISDFVSECLGGKATRIQIKKLNEKKSKEKKKKKISLSVSAAEDVLPADRVALLDALLAAVVVAEVDLGAFH